MATPRQRKLETSDKSLWPKLKAKSRELRRAATPAEARLWARLRDSRLGIKFRRQHVIDRFVVDFFCEPARLVVEVDGPVHRKTAAEDRVREQRLRELGFEVLRFGNAEVESELDAVLSRISATVARLLSDESGPRARH